MTQPVQVPPLKTIQINANNEKGGWTNMQFGVVNAPISGVSLSQTPCSYKKLDTTGQPIIPTLFQQSITSE